MQILQISVLQQICCTFLQARLQKSSVAPRFAPAAPTYGCGNKTSCSSCIELSSTVLPTAQISATNQPRLPWSWALSDQSAFLQIHDAIGHVEDLVVVGHHHDGGVLLIG